MNENEIILRQVIEWVRTGALTVATAVRLADSLDPQKDSVEAYRLRDVLTLYDATKGLNRGRKKGDFMGVLVPGVDRAKLARVLRSYGGRYKGEGHAIKLMNAPAALACMAQALIGLGYLDNNASAANIRRLLLYLLTGDSKSNDFGSESAFYENFNIYGQDAPECVGRIKNIAARLRGLMEN